MSLQYLLDTDICIYLINKNREKVAQKFGATEIGETGISVISYGELWYGVQKSHFKEKNKNVLKNITHFIPVIPFSADIAPHYGNIRSSLEKSGKIIGNNDLWIAAHALALDVTLVTNNNKEFARIPNLKVENWIEE